MCKSREFVQCALFSVVLFSPQPLAHEDATRREHANTRGVLQALLTSSMKRTRWLRLLTVSLVVVACSGRRPGTVRPTLSGRQKAHPEPNRLWHELFPHEATPLEKVLKAVVTPVVVPFVVAQLLLEQCYSLARVAVSGTWCTLRYVFDRVFVPALRGIHAHILRPLAAGAHKYLILPTSKALERAADMLGEVLLRALWYTFRMLYRLDCLLDAVYARLARAFGAVSMVVGKARAALARAIGASASRLVRVARGAARRADWTLRQLGVYLAVDAIGRALATLADGALRILRAAGRAAALTLRALDW